MVRLLFHLMILSVLLSGCWSGDDSVSRSDGPLGAEDLPAGHSEQVTTISVRGDEGEWHATEYRYTTLNRAGDPLETVFIMEHPKRAFDTALTYEYDDRERRHLEKTWHWKQDAGWTEISRVETVYDAEDRPSEERASSRDAAGWIDTRLVQYSYGRTPGAVTRIISVPRFDDEGMPDNTGSGRGSDTVERTMWRNDMMEERFKSQGRVDSVRTYSWVDGRWIDGHRTVFTYDQEGEADEPDETVIYRHGNHTWIPFMRTTHMETAPGKHETLIHHRRGSEWIVTRREVTRSTQ